MPGVIVTTAVRTGPVNVQTAATATMFVAGVTTRGPDGPNNAFLVTSIADFEAIYGGYTSAGWVHQTVQTFFEEGGARAYVSRVVAADADEATCILLDGATPVITLESAGKGTWSHSGVLTATVTQPTGSTFKIQIKIDGAAVYTTKSHTTTLGAVDEINNSNVAAIYVTASDEGETTIPDVVANKVFTTGDDGSAIVNADVVAAIGYFNQNMGPGAVCAPGYTNADVRTALLEHAQDNNRVAILGFDKDLSVGDAIDEVNDYTDLEDQSERAAFFYPWVKVPNGNVTMTIPPDGYVAAKRAVTHSASGSWTPYAGERTESQYVTVPAVALSKADAQSLDDGYINAIKLVNNKARIYGARSASSDTDNFRFITAREVLNQVVAEAEASLEALLFLPIDGRRSTFGKVEAVLTGIMARIHDAGGLFESYDQNGKLIDPGYSVQVNDVINPLSQLATGVIKAKVSARVSSIGDKIEVTITKSNLTTNLG
jgi:hypothetical protein